MVKVAKDIEPSPSSPTTSINSTLVLNEGALFFAAYTSIAKAVNVWYDEHN